MWCDKTDWVMTCIGVSWVVIIAAVMVLFELALYGWSRWHARQTMKRKILEVYDRATGARRGQE